MKIINPYDHHVIKQIKASSFITNEVKAKAIKEILKMIMDSDYRKANHGWGWNARFNITGFMEIGSLGMLFTWDLNHLGYDFWAKVSAAIHKQHYKDQEYEDTKPE